MNAVVSEPMHWLKWYSIALVADKYTRWTSVAARSEQIHLKNGTTIKTKEKIRQTPTEFTKALNTAVAN